MIYVTGSNGLIGRSLKKNLIKFTSISYRDNLDEIEFDVHEDATLIHLASSSNTRYTIDSSVELYMRDVNLSLELFKKFLNKNPNGRIILLSSCGDLHWSYYEKIQNEQSVPFPKTIHGAHKLLLENYGNILTQNTKAKFIVLRVTNVYGGDVSLDRVNGFIDKYVSCFKNNSIMQVYSNQNSSYDWIHLDDVVSSVLSSISYNSSGTFLIGDGNSYSLKHLLNLLKNNIGDVKLDLKECLNPAVHVVIDPRRAEDLLGWTPKISLTEGIQIIKKTLDN
jgi:nucleoside-diphosphate-sugar epimerase